jgi:hypothetical protein
VTRLLGRYQIPGCCPGTRKGLPPGPDCSGGGSGGARQAKRREQRALAASVADDLAPEPSAYLHGPLFDWSDCQHGCNGDCVVADAGSDVCTWQCHPGMVTDPVKAARFAHVLAEIER